LLGFEVGGRTPRGPGPGPAPIRARSTCPGYCAGCFGTTYTRRFLVA
jgi:hypothetical protein